MCTPYRRYSYYFLVCIGPQFLIPASFLLDSSILRYLGEWRENENTDADIRSIVFTRVTSNAASWPAYAAPIFPRTVALVILSPGNMS